MKHYISYIIGILLVSALVAAYIHHNNTNSKNLETSSMNSIPIVKISSKVRIGNTTIYDDPVTNNFIYFMLLPFHEMTHLAPIDTNGNAFTNSRPSYSTYWLPSMPEIYVCNTTFPSDYYNITTIPSGCIKLNTTMSIGLYDNRYINITVAAIGIAQYNYNVSSIYLVAVLVNSFGSYRRFVVAAANATYSWTARTNITVVFEINVPRVVQNGLTNIDNLARLAAYWLHAVNQTSNQLIQPIDTDGVVAQKFGVEDDGHRLWLNSFSNSAVYAYVFQETFGSPPSVSTGYEIPPILIKIINTQYRRFVGIVFYTTLYLNNIDLSNAIVSITTTEYSDVYQTGGTSLSKTFAWISTNDVVKQVEVANGVTAVALGICFMY